MSFKGIAIHCSSILFFKILLNFLALCPLSKNGNYVELCRVSIHKFRVDLLIARDEDAVQEDEVSSNRVRLL